MATIDVDKFIVVGSTNYELGCNPDFHVNVDSETSVVFTFVSDSGPPPHYPSLTNGNGDVLEPTEINVSGNVVDYDYILTQPFETFHLTVTRSGFVPYDCEFTIATNIPLSFTVDKSIEIDSVNYELDCDTYFYPDVYEETTVTFTFFASPPPFFFNDYVFTLTNGDGDILEPSSIFPSEGRIEYVYVLTQPLEDFHLTVTNPLAPEDYNCDFTITTNIPPPVTPMSVSSFVVDDQPVACGGTYYKFCDLSARTSYISCNSDCSIDIAGHITTNEAESFDYVLEVGTHVFNGTVSINDLDGVTNTYTVPITSSSTDIHITYTSNDEEPVVIECTATVIRLNSKLFNMC